MEKHYPVQTAMALSDEVSKLMNQVMSNNISEAELIYELCKHHQLLDSQMFMDWQDKLNTISVKYR